MKNLPVDSLEFKGIKEKLIDFLKNNPSFQDFNFEGSGISTVINLLAYNTHYLGFYVKMLLDEAFVDTAHTKKALFSHAKRVGYLPKGKTAAKAEIQLRIFMTEAQEPASQTIVLERGTSFTSANSQQDRRTFYNMEEVQITNRTLTGDTANPVMYESEVFEVFEGAFLDWNFLVDSEIEDPHYIIDDPNIDISTLRVSIIPHEGSFDKTEFLKAGDVYELTNESNVFFISTNHEGKYQIFFGKDVFGYEPKNGEIIQCEYLQTNGETGNGARTFTFQGDQVGNFESFSVITHSMSSGGMEEESVKDLRFSIPHHYRRQNRIVTAEDMRAVILTEFRNVESISVWSGENAVRREYGKIFVSVKPKNSEALTKSSRERIMRDIKEKYGIVGLEVGFVDPEFINVEVNVTAKIDKKKTNKSASEFISLIKERIENYSVTTLNKFDALLSNNEMLNVAKGENESIRTIYSKMTLKYKTLVIKGNTSAVTISIGNPFSGEVYSSDIVYAGSTWYLMSESGIVYLVDKNSTNQRIRSGEVDYDKGEIVFVLPEFSFAAGFQNESAGQIEFTIAPKNPDVVTFENKIVRITKIEVDVQ